MQRLFRLFRLAAHNRCLLFSRRGRVTRFCGRHVFRVGDPEPRESRGSLTLLFPRKSCFAGSPATGKVSRNAFYSNKYGFSLRAA